MTSNRKYGKYAVMLLAVALGLMMFAGAAFAADNMAAVTINGQSYGFTGGTGCLSDYTFEVTNINTISAKCLNNAAGSDIYITFGLDGAAVTTFGIQGGYSVPVKFHVVNATGGEVGWKFAQPTVEATTDGKAKLHIENLQIVNADNLYIDRIVIGDKNQNLKVQNPCQADEYCAEIFLDSACADYKVRDDFQIFSAPYAIDMIAICSNQVNAPCDDAFSVSGTVKDCGGVGVGVDPTTPEPYLGWPVTVKVLGTAVTASGRTQANGTFDIDFIANLAPGKYQIEASAVGPCGTVKNQIEVEVVKNLATRIEISTVDYDGLANELRYNKCNDVIIKLLDDCGYPAVLGPQGGNVYVTATQPSAVAGQPPVVAGHFYPNCPTDRTQQQLNTVVFGALDSQMIVSLIPLEKGPITITGTARVVDKNLSGSGVFQSTVPTSVSLEIVPLVTDANGNPRAGWPVAAAVRLDKSASEDYKVNFTLNGADITFDDETAKFEAAFQNIGEHSAVVKGIYPFCNAKWYFMLYPDRALAGQPAAFTVNVAGVGAAQASIKDFVSPVEMTRSLLPDAWQTLSTPKLLADPGEQTPEFGHFTDLLAPLYKELNKSGEIFVLKYKNGEWQFVDCSHETVDPLSGYFVRTPQREVVGRAPFQLEYVFARATDPAYSVPFTAHLDDYEYDPALPVQNEPTWNSVGVSVNPAIKNTLTLQSDTAAQAFGSILYGSKVALLWNPGVKLANVNGDFVNVSLTPNAFETYLSKPYTEMYNGDVYWLYSTGEDKTYSANVGLDIIEWVGGLYQTLDRPK